MSNNLLLRQRESDLREVLKGISGTIDVFIVREEGMRAGEVVVNALEGRANAVYFVPKTSHRVRQRAQGVEGEFVVTRPAIIADVSWWNGNSFREVFGFLRENGYDSSRVFVYYLVGDSHPSEETEYSGKAHFSSSDDFKRLLCEYRRR